MKEQVQKYNFAHKILIWDGANPPLDYISSIKLTFQFILIKLLQLVSLDHDLERFRLSFEDWYAPPLKTRTR